MRTSDIHRLLLGTFVRPAVETGTGRPRVEAVYGYLVRHDRGSLLLDTGLGSGDAETEDWYRPRRVPLPEALHGAGVALDEITVVVNCHLHFDHCGGNPLLAGVPVLCQRRELAAAQRGNYTMEHLLDYPGSNYELLDGEAEMRPGIHVIPTPGHVEGHQSLVVECDDGSVVLAGQSHDTASEWSADVLAVQANRLGHRQPLPSAPAWMERLLRFDPKRVVFAHDAAVWEPESRMRRVSAGTASHPAAQRPGGAMTTTPAGASSDDASGDPRKSVEDAVSSPEGAPGAEIGMSEGKGSTFEPEEDAEGHR